MMTEKDAPLLTNHHKSRTLVLQGNDGFLYHADQTSDGIVNIRPVKNQGVDNGVLSAVIDPTIMDETSGRYALSTRIVCDVMFYEQCMWLLYAFTSFITFLIVGHVSSGWIGMIVCMVGTLVAYIGLIISVERKLGTESIISVGCVWILNNLWQLFLALWLDEVAPIQLGLMLWASSLGVMVYCTRYRDKLAKWHILAVLFACSLLGWAFGILAYIHEKDWIMACIILVVGWLISGYRWWWIMKTQSENRYCLEETLIAIMDLYADPGRILWTKISTLAHSSSSSSSNENLNEDLESNHGYTDL